MWTEKQTRAAYNKTIDLLIADLRLARAKPELIADIRAHGVSGITRIRWRDADPVIWDRITHRMSMAEALELVLQIDDR